MTALPAWLADWSLESIGRMAESLGVSGVDLIEALIRHGGPMDPQAD